MKWTDALKAYAAKNGGKYVVPRKGTKEYDEVKAMMGAAKGEAKAEEAKGEMAEAKAHKAEGKALRRVVAAHKAEGEVMKKERKPRKPRAPPKEKKERKPRASRAAAAPKEKAARKPRATHSSKGKTEQAVAKSANPGAVFESETNAHLPGSAPSAIADLTGQVKKAVRRRPAVSKAVDAEKPTNAVPFSVTDVKRELGA